MRKKYIVELCGGLGNQIFQYALFLYLSERGDNCYLNANKRYLQDHGGITVNRVFPISAFCISKSSMIRFYSNIYGLMKGRIIPAIRVCLPRLYVFFERINPVRDVLFPEWDTYSFIGEISDKRKYFSFPELDNRNLKIAEEMQFHESVSIHVRRGDYQKVRKWRLGLGDICDKFYYEKAILLATHTMKSPVFYVFSDDIEWVKMNLQLPAATYIDWNTGADSYKDMQLMTYCKANICANSTFSLIAAWLNTNDTPTIVVPQKWSNKKSNNVFHRYIPNDGINWKIVENLKPQVSLICCINVCEKDVMNILQQTYDDFEILNVDDVCKVEDERIVKHKSPRGNYIYNVYNIDAFENPNHLREWMMNQFVDCEE